LDEECFSSYPSNREFSALVFLTHFKSHGVPVAFQLPVAQSWWFFVRSFDLTMEFWILGAKNLVMRLLWRLRLRGPAWPAACNACTWVATT
jgi:hypothetical protein